MSAGRLTATQWAGLFTFALGAATMIYFGVISPHLIDPLERWWHRRRQAAAHARAHRMQIHWPRPGYRTDRYAWTCTDCNWGSMGHRSRQEAERSHRKIARVVELGLLARGNVPPQYVRQ